MNTCNLFCKSIPPFLWMREREREREGEREREREID